MKDFYYILGVDANCTLNNIKEAYRKLSKKFHPDLNQGDAYFENRFKEIKEAYDTLSDSAKRNKYDQQLKETFSHQTFNQPPHQTASSPRSKFQQRVPGIGMSVVLILLVLIVGAYIISSLSSSKTRILLADAVAVNPMLLKTHKHHKKRHILNNKVSKDSFKTGLDSSRVMTRQSVNDKLPQAESSDLAIPVSRINQNKDHSYTTYLRPNVTGVINMRELDNYSSAIIAKIPANSKITVIEKGDRYYKIAFNNTVGYVPKWSIASK